MNKIVYIYSEEFDTNIDNPTEEDLIEIFNQKFFKTIMKIEQTNFEEDNL